MRNIDLNADIAEFIFSWKTIPVSADFNGENATTVLFWPHKEATQDDYNQLPRVGKPHRGFFTPNWSGEWHLALELAKQIQLDMHVVDMPKTPEELAQKCLIFYQNRNTRCTGRSTRLADRYIQKIYNNPGQKVYIVDHPSEVKHSRFLFEFILRRLREEKKIDMTWYAEKETGIEVNVNNMYFIYHNYETIQHHTAEKRG